MTFGEQQQQRIDNLVTGFEHIYRTTMGDVPIVNPNLHVAAVDFRPWSTDYWDNALLGILITPWFMNLIALPVERLTHSSRAIGTRTDLMLPAGTAECLWSSQADLGVFLSCSLMSPVTDIETQEQAETLASQTLSLLLTFPRKNGQDIEPEVAKKTTRRGLLKRFTRPNQSRGIRQ